MHLRKVALQRDVDAEKIAALTPGFAGADLANLVNETAMLATRRRADAVAMQDSPPPPSASSPAWKSAAGS